MKNTHSSSRSLRRALLFAIGISVLLIAVKSAVTSRNHAAVAVDVPTLRAWQLVLNQLVQIDSTSGEKKSLAMDPTVSFPCLKEKSIEVQQNASSDLRELVRRVEEITSGQKGLPSLTIDRHKLARVLSVSPQCDAVAVSLNRLLWTDTSRQKPSDALNRLDWYFMHKSSDVTARLQQSDYVRIGERLLSKENPWSTTQHGCVFVKSPANSLVSYVKLAGTSAHKCAEVTGYTQADFGASISPSVVPSFQEIVKSLDVLRKPGSTFLSRSEFGSTVDFGGAKVTRGLNVELAIDIGVQHAAQKIAECFVRINPDCQRLYAYPKERMAAGEPARMIAIAMIDVESGGIVALANANSRCLEVTHLSQSVDGCPKLGAARNHRPDRLTNRALFAEAMPGSIVKPLIALGSLASEYPESDSWLMTHLPPSNSRIFMRSLTCAGKPNESSCDVAPLAQMAATELGWNRECHIGSKSCGTAEYVFGAALADAAAPQSDKQAVGLGQKIAAGRFMVQADDKKGMSLLSPQSLESSRAYECSPSFKVGPCRLVSETAKKLVNQGWGQGDLQSSPVGVAELYANIARAAKGKQPIPARLTMRVFDDTGQEPLRAHVDANVLRLGSPIPKVANTERAQRVMRAMNFTHVNGTARAVCRRLKTCPVVDALASKTGSVTAPTCHKEKGCLAQVEKAVASGDYRDARAVPYKWYAGMIQIPSIMNGRQLSFAVLTERNWALDGRVMDSGDSENISALVGLQLIDQLQKQKPHGEKGRK